MKKILSLLKVCLTQDMSLFKIKSKNASKKTQILLPIVLFAIIACYMGGYGYGLMDQFKPMNQEYVALTLFAFVFAIITLFEGFYKSGSLLFNCKDDQLLFSLPLDKKTILFIRMFKFYVFEFLFNSMFLAPVMAVYGVNMNQPWTFYLVSIVALFIIPIIPIVISCIFGFGITYISSKFKGKNLVQTIITMSLVLVILYYSFNMDSLMNALSNNAGNIDSFICKYYYPVGAYMSMVHNFDIVTLLIYIVSHIAIFALTIFVIGKIYFNLNSKMKNVSVIHNKKPYVVKTRSRLISFIKKEFSRFVSTPVFITNSGFGLVMFVAACIAVSFKYDAIVQGLVSKMEGVSPDVFMNYIPVGLMTLLAFSAFMTSITSSMISLEGKSLNILKSLPIKSSMIVLYKVITAMVIIVPCLLLGDLIVFIVFKFDIISILCALYASLLLPFIAELIGIMVNLKYPKMDATNDTEIVKQSMSSMISVFVGMALAMFSSVLLIGLAVAGLSNVVIQFIFLIIFTIVAIALWVGLISTADKSFNEIQV